MDIHTLLAYVFDPGTAIHTLPFLLEGLKFTILIAASVMAIGSTIGLFVALGRLSTSRPIRTVASIYTEVFRMVPTLVFLVWVYFVLPAVTGIDLPPVLTAIAALSLNAGAFLAEIFRAGILSVEPGQREAALALGMSHTQTLRRIVLPQAGRRVIPPVGATWVSLFKDTALVSVIAVPDLMYQGRVAAITTYRPMEVLTAVALIYFLITAPQFILVNRLYARLLPEER